MKASLSVCLPVASRRHNLAADQGQAETQPEAQVAFSEVSLAVNQSHGKPHMLHGQAPAAALLLPLLQLII